MNPYAPRQVGVGYPEGDEVRVLCQVPDGRLVEDSVPGRALSSTARDKTLEGVWIPDIYPDPPGLPARC